VCALGSHRFADGRSARVPDFEDEAANDDLAADHVVRHRPDFLLFSLSEAQRDRSSRGVYLF
jgi:hypothetical protein